MTLPGNGEQGSLDGISQVHLDVATISPATTTANIPKEAIEADVLLRVFLRVLLGFREVSR